MMAQRQQLTENGLDVLDTLILTLLSEKDAVEDSDTVDSILSAISKKKK